MDKLLINCDEFPESANLATWTKLLGLSYVTMLKHRKAGRLNGVKDLGGKLTISRETVMKCFNLKPKPETATKVKK